MKNLRTPFRRLPTAGRFGGGDGSAPKSQPTRKSSSATASGIRRLGRLLLSCASVGGQLDENKQHEKPTAGAAVMSSSIQMQQTPRINNDQTVAAATATDNSGGNGDDGQAGRKRRRGRRGRRGGAGRRNARAQNPHHHHQQQEQQIHHASQPHVQTTSANTAGGILVSTVPFWRIAQQGEYDMGEDRSKMQPPISVVDLTSLKNELESMAENLAALRIRHQELFDEDGTTDADAHIAFSAGLIEESSRFQKRLEAILVIIRKAESAQWDCLEGRLGSRIRRRPR